MQNGRDVENNVDDADREHRKDNADARERRGRRKYKNSTNIAESANKALCGGTGMLFCSLSMQKKFECSMRTPLGFLQN